MSRIENIKNCTFAFPSENDFPYYYTYKTDGYKRIYMSNNVSSLGIVGSDDNSFSEQVVCAYLNTNIKVVMESCFMNCTNLTAINADNNIKYVRDYAFYNCSKLKSLNFLDTRNKELKNVGSYAFAKSGLTSINLNLQSSVSTTSYGQYTFYNCPDLVEVNLEGAPYLSYHMFDGCTSLSKITINDKHSYVNPYCFANCTSLESIELPANCYMLASHMFDGCSNLKSVTFKNGSALKQIQDHVFANCPKLTALVLPESIDSLSTIDSEFLAGSNIQKITFLGLGDDSLTNEVKITIVDFPLNTWYTSKADINNYYSICKSKHIPFFWYYSGGSGCGHCTGWKEIINSNDFKTWVSTESNIALFSGSLLNSDTSGQDSTKKIWSDMNNLLSEDQKNQYIVNSDGTYTFVIAGFYWNKLEDDGSITTHGYMATTFENRCSNISKFKEKVKTLFTDNGWDGGNTVKVEIKEEITTFGKGTGLSVTYVSSTGNEYVCGNDAIIKSPDYRVDKYTIDNFKYGIWYYNIKELKQFADENHIPIIAEWSHAGCDPCIDFKNNTWRNSDFQDAIKTKNCLFCRIECEEYESWDYPVNSQRYYISHTFGDPKTLIPQFVFYWNKDGTNIVKEIWNYNYRTDPANANWNTVINKIDNFIGDYTPDPEYRQPLIYTSENTKFRYYQNEDGDINGKYFICDEKTQVNSYSETQLSIDIQSGTVMSDSNELASTTSSNDSVVVLDSITVGQEVTIPNYTYQYFTTESSSSFKDEYGVIFKVENSKISYIYKFNNYTTTTPIEDPTGRYQTGTVISMDSTTSQNGFNDVVDYSAESPDKLLVIFKLNSGSASTTFYNNVLKTSKFRRWLRTSPYLFIQITSDTWTTNAPAALQTFETDTDFDDNVNEIPKILVFRGCSSCIVGTSDVKYAIYCKKVIRVTSDKSSEYYMNLIDEYSKIGS